MTTSDHVAAPFAQTVRIARITTAAASEMCDDAVAVEEPLEVRVNRRPFVVLMRTPGHDIELACGHLLTEAVIRKRTDIIAAAHCEVAGNMAENVVNVDLSSRIPRLSRPRAVGSSCGTCGKTSIEEIHKNFAPIAAPDGVTTAAVIQELPRILHEHQATFRSTGGLHGVALFRANGELLKLREDVGRHNAVDKVIGFALLNNLLPLTDAILFVSGRISFEIMQKALAARIPVVAGISAPTSLAIDFAQASGQTLLGFVREGRSNVYAGRLARK